MLYDFIATIAVAMGAGGLALALRHLSGWRLPRWLVPATMGLAILAYTVWNEYSWYERTRGALPESVVVLAAPADSVFYRPWTYLAPQVTRFLAIDRAAVSTTAADPALRLGRVQVVERWAPTRMVPMAFDCAGGRLADMVDGAAVAADGTVSGVTWRDAPDDDPILKAVCQGG